MFGAAQVGTIDDDGGGDSVRSGANMIGADEVDVVVIVAGVGDGNGNGDGNGGAVVDGRLDECDTTMTCLTYPFAALGFTPNTIWRAKVKFSRGMADIPIRSNNDEIAAETL